MWQYPEYQRLFLKEIREKLNHLYACGEIDAYRYALLWFNVREYVAWQALMPKS